jgi:hypothetical protein
MNTGILVTMDLNFLSFSKSCTLLKVTLKSSTAPDGAVRDFSPQEVN